MRAEPSATDRVLHGLDAATRGPDHDHRRRAATTLERILRTDPDAPVPSATLPPPRRRRHRVVLAGAAVAAFTTVAVMVPVVIGGDEAFASWSPTPSGLTGAARRAAVDACLVLQADGGGDLAFDPAADATVAIAEKRGGWSYVILTVTGVAGRELEASCLMPESLIRAPRPGKGGFFGSLGGAEESAGPAPRADVGTVDDDAFVYAEGRAGVDVVAIEVTTPSGREVEASLENGRWAVWWPAGDDTMDNPEVAEAPTFTVTLRDGTVTDEVRGPA
jgi:hypothetical protein